MAFGFLSRAITFTFALVVFAAERALLISGPLPAPKYSTTIGLSLNHLDFLGLLYHRSMGWVLDNACTFSLRELSISLHVSECFLASFFVQLILDRVILKGLVGGSLEVISKWLEW